jgi:site-specific DNA-adenine methylase
VTLKPFFTYFGGKYRAATHYPSPRHDLIIEPFAGAAGYSLRHHTKNVYIIDKDPTVAALWQWLIRVPAERIRALPLIVEDVRVLDVEPEAKSLIGFWLNKGTPAPRNTPSKWMRDGTHSSSFWGVKVRERVASQVDAIRHWVCDHGSYEDVDPNAVATWYIDPPYMKAGTNYRESSKNIDFEKLGSWCRQRAGQVIVCENEGADWLPFRPFKTVKANESRSGGKQSVEVIWTNDRVAA